MLPSLARGRSPFLRGGWADQDEPRRVIVARIDLRDVGKTHGSHGALLCAWQ